MSDIQVEDMLSVEKVSKRQNEELLKIARLQGQWTSAKSLQHQAELLDTSGPIMRQFEIHLERVESSLRELGALKPTGA